MAWRRGGCAGKMKECSGILNPCHTDPAQHRIYARTRCDIAMETVFLPHQPKVNKANVSVEFENAEDMLCTRMLFPSALGKSDNNLRKKQLLFVGWKKVGLMCLQGARVKIYPITFSSASTSASSPFR